MGLVRKKILNLLITSLELWLCAFRGHTAIFFTGHFITVIPAQGLVAKLDI